jgi:serine/threonine protein kinase
VLFDTRLNRIVAVKVLPESFASDADRLQRFEREARVLSTLNHPNLLSIFDVGTEGGIHYLVSEFLDGQTLRERLSSGPLPQRRATDYAMQIASGLSAAHDKGIVHRDLKPDNVFVTRDERVKILDFGLAKQTRAAEVSAEGATLTGPTPTAAGVVLGTVGYMSPEQVRAQATDHRSDIFSFGAILYEMVSGKRAFKGDSSIETMNAMLKVEPLELAEGGPPVSPGLERIVRRCPEKSPERRFQSASDLAFAIEALSGASSNIAVQAPARHLSGRPKWLRRSVVVVILLAGTAVGYLLTRLVKREPTGLGNILFQQLTFQSEVVFNARFAPDGETVLYSSATDGNTPDLFIHRADYPAPQSMASPMSDCCRYRRKGNSQSSLMLFILRNDSSGARCRKLQWEEAHLARFCRMSERRTGLRMEQNWPSSARLTERTASSFLSGKCFTQRLGI